MKLTSPRPDHLGFACACVAALALGVALRLKLPAQAAAGAEPFPPSPAGVEKSPTNSKWDAASPAKLDLLHRRAIARCDDASLWQWAGEGTDDLETLEAVMKELVDRHGWGAWRHLLEMEEGDKRHGTARWLFAELAERDPWRAFEEWKKERDDSSQGSWADLGFYHIMEAAAAVSADKVVEVMREGRQVDDDFGAEVEYAVGFDFQKVLAFLKYEGGAPSLGPRGLLSEWAKQSPLEAAEWVVLTDATGVDKDEREGLYRLIAALPLEPEVMKEALGTLEMLPDVAKESWEDIGSCSRGVVEPALLQSSALLGRHDEYLMRVLQQTRLQDSIHESWQEIPMADRLKAKAAVEKKWQQELQSAVDERARRRWNKMLDEAWKL